ncbi:DUF6732 family protein [Jannaschia seohaensis]|uniref:LPXTG-motif cell wall anchor domain-containing protein n=1 Tax=Jannaschia seohaensis TaxID=475081 RepID=A0A2Y9A1C1_9RHOB|nr:DUF6732 family protein [Jannaschia seohaensis]PWJ21962.1 hypothetical protein BCF38_101371 [Jannaschia seohaensis]SSA38240.1 hypothetical protein SAMN05421539_101371 [Jannaschia seohaensis]
MLRFLPLFLLAVPAQAHTGHFGELAGHDHWVLGAGLGAIAGAAAIAWVKGRRKKDEPEEPSEEADTPEEAPA